MQSGAHRVELLAVPFQAGRTEVLWRTRPERLGELFSQAPNGRFLLVSSAQQRDLAELGPNVLAAWNSGKGTQHVVALGTRFSDVTVSPRGDRLAWTSGDFITMSQPMRVSPTVSPGTEP
jgi:hypothetical protein